jgi:hypothetical protein
MSWKKLALVISLVLLGGINNNQSKPSSSGSSGNPCPHQKFSQKHHCLDEPNEQNALRYSRARNNNPNLGRKTNINTVFFGTSNFILGEDGRCINEVAAST